MVCVDSASKNDDVTRRHTGKIRSDDHISAIFASFSDLHLNYQNLKQGISHGETTPIGHFLKKNS